MKEKKPVNFGTDHLPRANEPIPDNLIIPNEPSHLNELTVTGNPPGRRKGAITKLSGASLLRDLMAATGRPYGEQLAENYRAALDSGDKNVIMKYDTLILNKVISDRIDVNVGSSEDQLAAKNAAFMTALAIASGAVARNSQSESLTIELDDIKTQPGESE